MPQTFCRWRGVVAQLAGEVALFLVAVHEPPPQPSPQGGGSRKGLVIGFSQRRNRSTPHRGRRAAETFFREFLLPMGTSKSSAGQSRPAAEIECASVVPRSRAIPMATGAIAKRFSPLRGAG